ncbi:MAG: hypothetical protein ACK50J_30105, partial [Planctomyces sp.]
FTFCVRITKSAKPDFHPVCRNYNSDRSRIRVQSSEYTFLAIFSNMRDSTAIHGDLARSLLSYGLSPEISEYEAEMRW